MEPRQILSFILRKLYKELAQKQNNFYHQDTKDMEDVNKGNALKKFISSPFTKSPIASFFMQ